MSNRTHRHVIIVGAGFAGLCMAAKLKQAGIDDLLILEKADEVGGTWRENTYPGAECDIPSALYSYSFAPNPTWRFKWSKQDQILDYLKQFARNRKLYAQIRFGDAVSRAEFNDEKGLWLIDTASGATLSCRHFICAVGQLHHPATPTFPGQTNFAGESFHSAQWRHDIDLQGKRVAVIGNAASAIQLIPEVARAASQLTVYQRSANWMVPKGDRPYSGFEKRLATVFPGLFRLYRFGIWCQGEFLLYPMIRGWRPFRSFGEWLCKRTIRKYISDPDLQRALVPDYPIGAKRILFSDNYYSALARDNVELVLDPISRFTNSGVSTTNSVERQHDVIVYATGFHSNPFLQSIDVVGSHGESLRDHWRGGAHAYLGIMTAGFPDLYLLYGPNTNTGHTSIVFKLEAQVGYILQLITRCGNGRIAVREQVENAFNEDIQRRLHGLAWNKVAASWYKDGGKITNNWPGSSMEYRRRTRHPTWEHFELSKDSGDTNADNKADHTTRSISASPAR